jgi:hypothetical protein
MAATSKPVRKAMKSGQSLSRKVNKDLMSSGLSRKTPDKKSNIKSSIHTHKINSGKDATKKEIKEMKKRH